MENTELSKQEINSIIEKKARERNSELGHVFYSENASDYTFINYINYDSFKLLVFLCSKSNSSISVKVYK